MVAALVVREPDAFSAILRANGFEVVNMPAVETVPIAAPKEINPDIDAVFVTSREAAKFLAGSAFRGRTYVLGRRSFEILNDRGFDLFFDASANTARDLVHAIPRGELAGRKLLFVRGEESMRTIPESLSGIATVEELVVYRTRRLPLGDLGGRKFDWICFFSPSAAASVADQLGPEFPPAERIAAIGETTAGFLESRGFRVDLVSPASNAEDFANELIRVSGVEN